MPSTAQSPRDRRRTVGPNQNGVRHMRRSESRVQCREATAVTRSASRLRKREFVRRRINSPRLSQIQLVMTASSGGFRKLGDETGRLLRVSVSSPLAQTESRIKFLCFSLSTNPMRKLRHRQLLSGSHWSEHRSPSDELARYEHPWSVLVLPIFRPLAATFIPQLCVERALLRPGFDNLMAINRRDHADRRTRRPRPPSGTGAASVAARIGDARRPVSS